MQVIYLHGLNSAGTSGKASVLREGLAPLPVLSPTYPAHRPAMAVQQLSRYLGALKPSDGMLLVGSSMGGFYGQYLARRFPVRRLYLINPALQPWTLLPFLPEEQFNAATGERYLLRRKDVEATRDFAVSEVCDGVPTRLFLDQADELIDCRVAQALYQDCACLHLYPGGSHQFEHMQQAVAVIRADCAALARNSEVG
jgi:hypothetical protein